MENNPVTLCLLLSLRLPPCLPHPSCSARTVPGRLTSWPVSLGPLASWLSVGQYLLAGYPRGEKSRCASPALALLWPLVWLCCVPP